MRNYVNKVLDFLSPKGKLSRKGFICIFICAIVSVELFRFLSIYLCEPFEYRIMLSINITETFGQIGLLTGFFPLTALMLYDGTDAAAVWGYDVGYGFLVEAIIADVLYILYIFQCIKRCHDIGRGWWWCFIPLFNPWWLLFKKV